MTTEPTQPLTDDEFEELTDDLAEIRERVALRRGFSKDPNTQWQRDEEALLAMADKLLSERGRLRTWDGLMELLDEKWPEDIFPTLEDDTARDPGPRVVSLLRWNIRLRKELAEIREEAARLRAENTAQAERIAELTTTLERPNIEPDEEFDAVREAALKWEGGRGAKALKDLIDAFDWLRSELAYAERIKSYVRKQHTDLEGAFDLVIKQCGKLRAERDAALGLDQDGEGQANG